jgi:solute:Na+ symporter, SSS family
MLWIDWAIIVVLFVILTIFAWRTRKYTRSVADFLVAGRSGGKYITCVSGGMAGLGAVSILGYFQMYYRAGLVPKWWDLMYVPAAIIAGLSGWVIYRYRQTRVMTMAQFFEIRYSKRFRIFAGILAWISGTLNFGIFPAVGARFFIYYCGLPTKIGAFGFEISTFAAVMFILLTIALFYCFLGGQISVMVTDFLQATFCSIVFIIVIAFLLSMFRWEQITESLSMASQDASLVHPFRTSQVKDFNVWFFVVGIIYIFYARLAWQGQTSYAASAKSAHHAKMGSVLAEFRVIAQIVCFVIAGICAYTVMHHPDFSVKAASINGTLETIANEQVRSQMIVPVVLSKIFPIGLLGAFCAVVLAAFISTNDTYLMSFGSIFVQDVIVPLRKKPIPPEKHIKLVRYAIVIEAILVFLWSLCYDPKQNIFMYLAVTGAVYTGGAGAVITGGLYWKRGTTIAAWFAMITGSTLAVLGVTLPHIFPAIVGREFPIHGTYMLLISMVTSLLVYIIVSLVSKSQFNMDRMLHRGRYADKDKACSNDDDKATGWKHFKINKEFTRVDKIIYLIAMAWTVVFTIAFIIVTIYNLVSNVSTDSWLAYWRLWIWLFFGLAVIWTVWLTIGGFADLKKLYHDLRTRVRNDLDDGIVVDHQNLDEQKTTTE